MPPKASHCQKAAAERVRAGKLAKKSMIDMPVMVSSGDTNTIKTDNLPSNLVGPIFIEGGCEECGYDGGVENWIKSTKFSF